MTFHSSSYSRWEFEYLIAHHEFIIITERFVWLFFWRLYHLIIISFFKQRRRLVSHANAKSKSEKFPPPHEDGGLGVPLGASHHMDPTYIPTDVPFSSNSLSYSVEPVQNWSGPLVDPASAGGARRKKQIANDARAARKEFTSKDK